MADFHRWHKRFALFPRRIGGRWIWLEKYKWRHLPWEQQSSHSVGQWIIVWHEFVLPDGYRQWRESFMIMGTFGLPVESWHEPSEVVQRPIIPLM